MVNPHVTTTIDALRRAMPALGLVIALVLTALGAPGSRARGARGRVTILSRGSSL